MPVQPLLLAVAAVTGAVAGMLGSFLHPLMLLRLPVGLVLALALTGCACLAGGLLAATRAGAASAAAGWAAPVLLLAAPRPEGDLVVAGSVTGYAWLLGGLAVAGAAVALQYARLK